MSTVSRFPAASWAEVTVLLTIEGCPLKNTIEQQVRDAAATVEGVERVQLQVGAMNPQQRSALRSMLKPERSNPFTAPGSLTRVFGVVSGKGGVGKSSMTANLAAASPRAGLRWALLTRMCTASPFRVCWVLPTPRPAWMT